MLGFRVFSVFRDLLKSCQSVFICDLIFFVCSFGLQIKGLDLEMNNVIIKIMEYEGNIKDLIYSFKRRKHNLLQICGDDFDIKDVLDNIREDFDSKNIEIFFPDDADEAIKSLRMKSLFGGKLIIVYDVDSLSASLFKEIKSSVSYPDKLVPNFVVLVFKNNKKIFKIKNSLIGKFKKVYDSDIPVWIRKFVAGKGYKISEEAINILHFSCGLNREEIKDHLERIILLKEEKDKNIVEKDLENIGFYRDDTIFKISNSIIEGKYHDALRYLIEYSDNMPIFHFVNRDIRCLLALRALLDEGDNLRESNLNGRLNMHPYIFSNKYLPSAKKLSYIFLEEKFDKIMDTEYKIKNGWEEFSMNFNFVSQLQ
jgi:DNA polymerase III delta subunit